MDFLNTFLFERSAFLWVLIPWLVLWIFLPRIKSASRGGNLKVAHVPERMAKSWRQWVLLLARKLPWLAGGALIVAAAGPYSIDIEEHQKGEGIQIFLALDLSASMLAKDFEPNRLEVAKNVASDFIARRPFDQIGLAAFAGEAYTVAPLTSDQAILQQLTRELQVGKVKDGTAIGMGLATAINRLRNESGKSQVIILLTDGVNNSGYISPRTAMDIAVQQDIKVYTIGVGSRGEAPVPFARQGNNYRYRMARVDIDEQLLMEIAEETGGQYYRAENEDELEVIYEEIDQLEKSEIQIDRIRQKIPGDRAWVLFAIFAWSLYFLIPHVFLKTYP